MIASLLTLGGVLLSNRDNTKRLMIQLDHDAAEKAKERVSAMRRDVYLVTVEELMKANAHLAGLPQRDITKENVADGLQGFLSSSAKLQLVAEPKTALLVAKLQGEYGELTLDLMRHLIPTSEVKTDIQIADELYSEAQIEVSRVLSEMSKQIESGNPRPEVWHALEKTFEFQQSQSAKYAKNRSVARQRFNDGNIVFQRFLFTRFRDISSNQIPVLMAIRRDLGLQDAASDFEEEMKLQSERIQVKLNDLIASLSDDLPLAETAETAIMATTFTSRSVSHAHHDIPSSPKPIRHTDRRISAAACCRNSPWAARVCRSVL